MPRACPSVLSWTPEHPDSVHTLKKLRSQAMTGTARKEGCMSFQRNTTRDAHDALE
ncbi:hypothetical protein BSU04_37415 [Caballeronia sordidicola]|uniref:Uncharacterized protein n=1 Tax=Caballeronia sordidicola TaxID=196367 RepID=A0A226WRA8_CABSO|nr:hypothetical protein BSU04_37415 [Caballeronia sordidicola]